MTSPQWDVQFLQSMRRIGDPVADPVIASVVDQHQIDKVNVILRSLIENDDIVTEHMPLAVHEYLKDTAHLPDWADPETLRRAEIFFELNWPIVCTLLLSTSLPTSYSCWRGAQVLQLTQRLTKNVHRRIFETAQFLLDVMAPGGLSPEGRGIRAAQKVRLLHACIRHYIENVPKWRDQWQDDWGTPINQEDMAGTLMMFSVQILVGMRRFRIPVSAEDEEAFLHAWKVIGHVMGVDPRLLPIDVADAYDLTRTIVDRQLGRSEAGVELTRDLIEFMQSYLPSRLLSNFPATIIRESVEPSVAEVLEVPSANWTLLLLRIEQALMRIVDRLASDRPGVSRLMARYSQRLVESLVGLERGGNRQSFRIPPNLRARV